jgi:hypothetical protein
LTDPIPLTFFSVVLLAGLSAWQIRRMPKA